MNRNDFFQKPDKPKTIDIELADGRTVKARKLTQAEVEHSKRRYSNPDKALEGLRYVVCRTVVDDNGDRVFEDADQEKLTELDFDIIKTIANEVLEFSGLTERDPKKP